LRLSRAGPNRPLNLLDRLVRKARRQVFRPLKLRGSSVCLQNNWPRKLRSSGGSLVCLPNSWQHKRAFLSNNWRKRAFWGLGSLVSKRFREQASSFWRPNSWRRPEH
jgi:hypothetical protein